MKLKLPQYFRKEYLVIPGILPGFVLFINYNIFGNTYFHNGRLFVMSTLVTGFGFCLDFIVCRWIGAMMKNRYPKERQQIKRITLVILIFLFVTGVFLYSLFQAYESFFFINYPISEVGIIWSYFSMGIINVFAVFLMEVINRYQTWKANWEETEKLKKAYKERQLLGLKNQVNQHFLFESLDSLSGLIHTDEDKAEKFLDEMTKVYRYMLRVDEEQLVTLETELKFMASYGHLLKARHGEALQIEVDINNDDKSKWLLPLSLQVIVDNTFTLNDISNANPLRIAICSAENNLINVSNTVQPKNPGAAMDYESCLDSLVNNYRLLINSPMIITDSATCRTIHLPLITREAKKEEMI